MKRKLNRGFSLLEMLIYIAIMTLLLVVIANMLNSMIRSERVADSSKAVENAAVFGLDRIVREIRDASLVSASSTLNTSPGVLNLSGTDTNGVAKSVEFSLTQGVLHIKENGVDKGALSESRANIINITFSLINSSSSKSIKTIMTVESGTSTAYRKETFYSTTILRGSI